MSTDRLWLPKDITDRLVADFPNEDLLALQAVLGQYRGNEQTRVIRCIVHSAERSLEKLRHYVGAAQTDYRNLIYWAEYTPADERVHDFHYPFDQQPDFSDEESWVRRLWRRLTS